MQPGRSSSSKRHVPGPDDPLRSAYLTYRGKPHVGGQGVYTRHLSKALVDPVSQGFLAGAEIDFVDDLMGQSFRINNPNATSSCGCGTSFSI